MPPGAAASVVRALSSSFSLPTRVTPPILTTAPCTSPSTPRSSLKRTVHHGSRLSMARSPSKPRSRASLFTKFLSALREAGIVPSSTQTPMSPALSPQLSSEGPIGALRPTPVPFASPASSSRSLPDNASIVTSPAYSSSSLSIPFDDGEVDVVRVEGLRHAAFRLEARSVSSLPSVVAPSGPTGKLNICGTDQSSPPWSELRTFALVHLC